MNSLIPISEKEGIQSVDGRELHDFLGVKRDFTTWMKQRISKYGFIEGLDHSPIRGSGSSHKMDYSISLDMAKQLAMVENNEKGQEARLYFIEVEKQFRQQSVRELSYEEQVANILTLTQAKIQKLELKVEEDAPKVQFHDAVTASDNVCKMAVACQVAGLPFGSITLYRNLRRDGVLISGGDRHNHPKQTFINQGLFSLEMSSYKNEKTDQTIVYYTTYATQKGIDWLIKKYITDASKLKSKLN